MFSVNCLKNRDSRQISASVKFLVIWTSFSAIILSRRSASSRPFRSGKSGTPSDPSHPDCGKYSPPSPNAAEIRSPWAASPSAGRPAPSGLGPPPEQMPQHRRLPRMQAKLVQKLKVLLKINMGRPHKSPWMLFSSFSSIIFSPRFPNLS